MNMFKNLSKIIAIILLTIIVPLANTQVFAVDENIGVSFKDLSAKIIKQFYVFDPVFASSCGIHDYDAQYMKMDSVSMKENLAIFSDFIKQLDKIDVTKLSANDAIDYRILKAELMDRIKLFGDMDILKKDPSFYLLHGLRGIYLLKERYPENEALYSRLKSFPELMQRAAMNVSKPYKIYYDTAKTVATGAIEYFDNLKLVKEAPIKRPEIVNAIKAYLVALMKIPEKDIDKSFPVTKDYYLWKLKEYYLIDDSIESMEKKLEAMIKESETELGNYLKNLPKSEYEPVYRSIDDVVPSKDFNMAQYLSDYGKEIEEVYKFLKDSSFFPLPEPKGKITLKVKPQFILPILSGFGFEATPIFDKNPEAFFYVNAKEDQFKDDENKQKIFFDMKNKIPYLSIVQIAYPGHFARSLYALLSNPSDIRKIHRDLFFENGWSSYGDKLMLQKGLYIDNFRFTPIVINGTKYRAIRALAEMKLCLGELDMNGTLEFLSKKMGTDEKSDFQDMITRSAYQPLSYLSYAIGKMKIDELKNKSIEKAKDKFDEAKFHVELLSSGSIPLKFK
jgi:hypothetical protein